MRSDLGKRAIRREGGINVRGERAGERQGAGGTQRKWRGARCAS